jgi:hypothetical protein
LEWFGVNPTDSSVGGYWDCYLVTVILVVWFVFLKIIPETQLEVLLLPLLVVYVRYMYAPSLELVLYTTRQFPYAPSGAGNLTKSWQLVFRTEISLSLERTPFEGQVVHDRSLTIKPLSSDSFACKTSHDSSADTQQRAKLNPTTITTPFCNQSRNPDHHPSRTL